jgi:hypothetical protein
MEAKHRTLSSLPNESAKRVRETRHRSATDS